MQLQASLLRKGPRKGLRKIDKHVQAWRHKACGGIAHIAAGTSCAHRSRLFIDCAKPRSSPVRWGCPGWGIPVQDARTVRTDRARDSRRQCGRMADAAKKRQPRGRRRRRMMAAANARRRRMRGGEWWRRRMRGDEWWRRRMHAERRAVAGRGGGTMTGVACRVAG